MADPTIFAPAPVQLPVITVPRPKTKKVIVVRRTKRASENGEDTASSIPTLPAIKQRESWSERTLISSPLSQTKEIAQEAPSGLRADFTPLPAIAQTDQTPVSESSTKSSVNQDANPDTNPDEFGALILANTARADSRVESAVQLAAAEQVTSDSSEHMTLKTDSHEEYPADIAAAIETSEDGGVAIREAYERRRQHRQELAKQAILLQRQQLEADEHFLASQRLAAGAEARAFEKWQQAQEEWAKVKRNVMAQTGKPEAELVMERGPEFRSLREAKEHLEAAKPTEDKFSGPAMWEMSLRNHWTITYPVGSIFGRVFAPPCSARPKELERIGRPETERIGTGAGTGTRPRGWLDSEVVKQRQHKLRKEMHRLQPHEPEIDGLQVVGYSIEAGLAAAAAAPITLEEVEKELAASNNHAYTQLLEERARAAAAAISSAPSEGLNPEATTQSGPALEMAAGRVTLCAAAGAIATEVLEVSNTGSTVLFYRWERAEAEGAAAPAREGGGVSHRFYQMDMEGALRPGERKGFGFSFRSRAPGTWLEKWRLVTRPEVASLTEPLILKGIAFEEEHPSQEAARREVEAKLAERVRARVVEEAVEALVDGVQTPSLREQEPPDEPEEVAREMDFVRKNIRSGEPLYYRPEEYARASAIADAEAAIEQRASKATEEQPEEPDSTTKLSWDGSVHGLKERLLALGSAGGAEGLRKRFGEIYERFKVPPNRRALLRRAMYEALTAVAAGVVEGVEAARDLLESEAHDDADAAAAAASTGGGEEEAAELADVELDEEVLRARMEAKEKAVREEAVRQAMSRAAEAIGGLEEIVSSADAAVAELLDGKIRAMIEKRQSGQADGLAVDWEVFALERQKKTLLHC